MGRSDDRDAARHRLDDGDAETLEPRRVRDDGGAAVERCELVVARAPDAHDARLVERRALAPPLCAGDGEEQLTPEQPVRVDEDAEVLARLERRDGEHVRASEVTARAVRPERRTDARRSYVH